MLPNGTTVLAPLIHSGSSGRSSSKIITRRVQTAGTLTIVIGLFSKIELEVGRKLVRVPPAVLSLLASRLHVSIDGNTLDPRVGFAVRLIERRNGEGLHVHGVHGGREQMRRLPALMDPPPPKVRRVGEQEIDGPRGMLRIRVYAPPGVHGDAPVLVYFHGGGGVVGDLDTHDVPCRVLCREASCVVASVEYGLAPESPFPQGLDDCVAAFRWVREHPEAIGGDGRVAVGGDSMGGNLAAAVAIETRDDEAGGPDFQLLIYPMTDAAGRTGSRDKFARGFLLPDPTIAWFRRTYLRGADAKDPRVSVLRCASHKGLAPAYVATAGFDPLRDEGHAYAEALREAGVSVEYRCFGDQVHGFLHMSGVVESSADALRDLARVLRKGFEHAG